MAISINFTKKTMTHLSRPNEIAQPIHLRIKAAYMNLPKKEIQDKINEALADNDFKGYTVPKQEFITILQSLL